MKKRGGRAKGKWHATACQICTSHNRALHKTASWSGPRSYTDTVYRYRYFQVCCDNHVQLINTLLTGKKKVTFFFLLTAVGSLYFSNCPLFSLFSPPVVLSVSF